MDESWRIMIPEKYRDIMFLCADDIQEILRIGENSVYTLLRHAPFRTVKVGTLIRIPSVSFWNWYFGDSE